MSLNNIRNIETSISVDNVKAQVETFLRTIKFIRNDEEVLELTIGREGKGLDISGKNTDVLPIKLKISVPSDEVEVMKF